MLGLGRAEGPVAEPADKRLAVHVEDHPVEYAQLRGLIPPGNYGAGAVIVWDRGRWVPLDDIGEGFVKGKILFELRGYKLRGKWTLVKTRSAARSEWLLIKERDAYANQRARDDYPHDSVLSGRTVEQVGAAEDRGAALARALAQARREAARAARLGACQPMLATPGKPFTRAGWVFELKYDGYPVARREARRPRDALARARATISPRRFRTSRRSSRAAVSRASSSTAR